MKKLILLIFVSLLLSLSSFAQSGTTGDLTWEISGDTLTISGTGAMPNYYSYFFYSYYHYDNPWHQYRETIETIVIDDGVTNIGWDAFAYCNNLTTVSIPNSVTSIGLGAFSGCNNLTSIIIPSSVTYIGSSAFSHCDGLTSVIIPSSVTYIGKYAFGDCVTLTDIYCHWIYPVELQGSYVFSDVSKSDCILHVPAGSKQHYEAADEWKEFVNIREDGRASADTLFVGRNDSTKNRVAGNLTWKTRGRTLTISGTGTMSDYDRFGNNKAPWIAYNHWKTIKRVEINDGVASIGAHAFYDCSGLTSVTIPNSVTSIRKAAFCNCQNLTSITIPNSVTSIGDEAFSVCFGLDSIVIPNSVTSIGKAAFAGCLGLTAVSISSNVKNIEKDVFIRCANLTSITIPNSVTSIGVAAFAYCSALTDIYSHRASPPELEADAFYDVNTPACTLHVPVGSKQHYEKADGWREFVNIQEDDF